MLFKSGFLSPTGLEKYGLNDFKMQQNGEIVYFK